MPKFNVDFDLVICCLPEVEAEDEEAAINKVAEMNPHEALKHANNDTVVIDSKSINISDMVPA